MLGGGKPLQSVGVDKAQLQARLYAQPDVFSPNKPPSLKVVKRPHRTQSGESAINQKLEPLPALSAYQKRKNEEILKTPPQREKEEEVNEPKVKHKEATLEPIANTPSLPSLPANLIEQQRSLSSRRANHFHNRSAVSHGKSHSTGKMNQSTLFLSTDPEMVVTKYSPPLEALVRPTDFIRRLKKEPELGFLYLTPAKGTGSTHYNPYNLR